MRVGTFPTNSSPEPIFLIVRLRISLCQRAYASNDDEVILSATVPYGWLDPPCRTSPQLHPVSAWVLSLTHPVNRSASGIR